MTHFLIGFAIAVAVGLTGIGGGSFTVPALVLIAGLPASEAVGTAFVFAGAIRLVAAPFYMLRKHVHAQYLWLLLKGAVPGLLAGTFALRLLSKDAGSPGVIILLGILLAASSAVTFAPRIQNPRFAKENARWLPWLALPRSAAVLKASRWIRPRERAARRSESVSVLSFCVSRPQHVARR